MFSCYQAFSTLAPLENTDLDSTGQLHDAVLWAIVSRRSKRRSSIQDLSCSIQQRRVGAGAEPEAGGFNPPGAAYSRALIWCKPCRYCTAARSLTLTASAGKVENDIMAGAGLPAPQLLSAQNLWETTIVRVSRVARLASTSQERLAKAGRGTGTGMKPGCHEASDAHLG